MEYDTAMKINCSYTYRHKWISKKHNTEQKKQVIEDSKTGKAKLYTI